MNFAAWSLLAGALLILMTLSATTLQKLPSSAAALYMAIGCVIGPSGLDWLRLDFDSDASQVEVISEVAVLISLFAVGLRLQIRTRGDTELNFWACNDKHIAENTSCYIRVEDIEAVHRELTLKLPALPAIVRTAWGMNELYVIDPDGNLIKFGQLSAVP